MLAFAITQWALVRSVVLASSIKHQEHQAGRVEQQEMDASKGGATKLRTNPQTM